MRGMIITLTFITLMLTWLGCGSKPTGIPSIPDMPEISAKDVTTGVVKLTPEQIKEELDKLNAVKQETVLKEYRLRFDDEFTIGVLGHDDWKSRVKVIPDGTIMFGYVPHSYLAFGKTFDELKKMILEGYTDGDVQVDGLVKYFNDPQLKIDEINLTKTANTVSIIGSFNKPGKIQFQVGYKIMDICAEAGGLRSQDWRSIHDVPTIDWNRAYVSRDNKILHSVSLYDLIMKNDFRHNIPVMPGDVINIPEASFDTNKIIVLGEVKTPGVINFSTQITLLEAIGRAGGFNEDRAEVEWVYILRNSTPNNDTDIELEIFIANLKDLLTKGIGANAVLQADDIVYISTSAWAKFCVDIGRFAPFWTNLTSPLQMAYHTRFIVN